MTTTIPTPATSPWWKRFLDGLVRSLGAVAV